ncbi:MAG: FAD-dependent oxidoreductase [Microcoleaceae cyanobacterium]
MIEVLPDLRTTVTVIGGGVAGIWTAYKLVKAGIPTIVITYLDSDRGGVQGSTSRSVGAINTSPIQKSDFASYINELGRGQTHPSVAKYLPIYLNDELEELASIFDLKTLKIGVGLNLKSTLFLQKMYELLELNGGRIVNGWVTRLVINKMICQGLQYETKNGIGKVCCHGLVLASGGYSSLFLKSIKTGCFGTVLGQYLQCGGLATNLEFQFKHGYGNIDTNDLTPTEELAGAEIYDNHQNRVTWLEKLLFEGKGTGTHLQAVQFWLRHKERDYFIDLSFRQLYLAVSQFNLLQEEEQGNQSSDLAKRKKIIKNLVSYFPKNIQYDVCKIILNLEKKKTIDYEMFDKLKYFANIKKNKKNKFKVKPIAYFSMGGIAHKNFLTNLKNVYVNGECMHDFGANRVGGLPWGMYLTSSRIICKSLLEQGLHTG